MSVAPVPRAGRALTSGNGAAYARPMSQTTSSESTALRPFTLATRAPWRDLSEEADAAERAQAQEEARLWARTLGIDTTLPTVAGTTNCSGTCKRGGKAVEDDVIDDTWDGPPQG